MAGGIDWYRAYHGTVEDSKLGLVAKKAGQRRGDVISIWHYVMERGSAADDRGNPGAIDFDALDFLLDLVSGAAQRVYDEFVMRGMVDPDTGRIAKWDVRQPKRERSTPDHSTERVQKHREAKRQETPGNADDGCETLDEGEQRQETPRGEERRGESSPNGEESGPALKRAAPPPPPFDGENTETIPARAVVTLSPQFALPEPWGEDAERLGWTPDRILKEAEKFRQHYVAGKGAGTRRGIKGWRQGWSNWLSNAERFQR